MAETPAPATLEYSRQSASRLRRYRWRIAFVVTLLLIAALGYSFRAPIARRASEVYWSRQCARFSAPADIVHVESVSANMLRPERHLIPTIVEPATLLSPPKVISPPLGAYDISERHVFANRHFGQRDPADPTHFTITVESAPMKNLSVPRRTAIVDAYLGDDDKITFKLRDPASTQGL